jgi:putative oxidoreductase
MDLGRTLVRGVIGPLFVGHGTQKLFGWFGGHGLEGTSGFFENLGLRPGKRHATAAGVAEAGGGLLLTLGAFTPLATTAISATMITAMRKVHLEKGPWVTSGGYEYNLVLIAAMVALAESGPGRPSVDAAAFPKLKGPGWAVASLAAAAAGSWLATERLTEPEQAEPETPEAEGQKRFTREAPTPAESTSN